MKVLVTYFSCSGITAQYAERIAKEIGADIFEIKPEVPYSKADANWKNPLARCNKEKFGKKDVPVAAKCENITEYDLVFVGFPIWYGAAPNVVNTFFKDYDMKGKKLAVFATSGGSKIGKTKEKLEEEVPGAEVIDAQVFKSLDACTSWARGLLV